MRTNVIKFPDYIDQQYIERLMSNIERDSAELLALMCKPDTREIIGRDLGRVELSRMRLGAIVEDFHE